MSMPRTRGGGRHAALCARRRTRGSCPARHHWRAGAPRPWCRFQRRLLPPSRRAPPPALVRLPRRRQPQHWCASPLRPAPAPPPRARGQQQARPRHQRLVPLEVPPAPPPRRGLAGRARAAVHRERRLRRSRRARRRHRRLRSRGRSLLWRRWRRCERCALLVDLAISVGADGEGVVGQVDQGLLARPDAVEAPGQPPVAHLAPDEEVVGVEVPAPVAAPGSAAPAPPPCGRAAP